MTGQFMFAGNEMTLDSRLVPGIPITRLLHGDIIKDAGILAYLKRNHLRLLKELKPADGQCPHCGETVTVFIVKPKN
jgi:hypothetical protein